MTTLPQEAYAVIEGRHSDPFHYLGLHVEGDKPVVRGIRTGCRRGRGDRRPGKRVRIGARFMRAGLFAGRLPNGSPRYRLRARFGKRLVEFQDAYRFPPVLSDFDLYLLGEGNHLALYNKLGAHPMTLDGVPGVAFAVFVPNASRVSVVGDFQFLGTGRPPCHARARQRILEIFVPQVRSGDHYKYEIIAAGWPYAAAQIGSRGVRGGAAAAHRLDCGRSRRHPTATAGLCRRQWVGAPMSIYEVHWLLAAPCRTTGAGSATGSSRTELSAYVPISASPMSSSCRSTSIRSTARGAISQPACFAPTSRFGSPADFAALVDACHQAGLAVWLDWVPGHFPDDPHGLGNFNGTAIYEHANPQQDGASRLEYAYLQFTVARSRELPCSPADCSGSIAMAQMACAAMRSPPCCISTTAGLKVAGFR